MPDGFDWGDMMLQIDAERTLGLASAAKARREQLANLAEALSEDAGVPVYANRGALHARARDVDAIRALGTTIAPDLLDAVRRVGDVPVLEIRDGDAWRWDPEAVATARLLAHERRVQPRIQHRLTEFVVRRTRARREARRGGAA